MKKDNINYLRDFIGEEWIDDQIDKIQRNSMLKERGNQYDTYHPFVHFKYEIDYLRRRAEIEGKEDVKMQQYHHILNNAGRLLKYNISKLPDLHEVKMRLRDSEHFDDIVWEIEVGTMLILNNASIEYKKPEPGSTNDLKFNIDGREIEVECKNKIIENEIYNRNQIFTNVLMDKLNKLDILEGKAIVLEFKVSRYEDINKIYKEVATKFDIFDYASINGRYKVRIKDKYLKMSIKKIHDDNDIRTVADSKEVERRSLFKEGVKGKFKTRFVVKFPEANTELKNIKSVLNKANKQLSQGGVVFLKVPHKTFEKSLFETKNILKSNYSNISAVKLFGLELSSIYDEGVREDRKEQLILSDRANLKLTQNEINFLSKNMFFTKYNNC